MDVNKQIDYWRAGSDEDIEVAAELLIKDRYRHALFFAHLALEKILKALVTGKTAALPPRIHNLVRLSELAGLNLTFDQSDFLRQFDKYQMEGRYPVLMPTAMDEKAVTDDFARAKEIRQWLKNQL